MIINRIGSSALLHGEMTWQVNASNDDGRWTNTIYNTNVNPIEGPGIGGTGGSEVINTWARWTGITIPRGATIVNAYISINQTIYYSPGSFQLYFNRANDAIAPTSYGDANEKSKTTNHITWNPSGSGWTNSGNISSIIQELVDSYTFSNQAMMMLWNGAGASANSIQYLSYNYSGHANGAKLYIKW